MKTSRTAMPDSTRKKSLKIKTSSESKNARNKNGHDSPEVLFSLPSMFRGIYDRVAKKVGCDPSYVSRVARGERNSEEVRNVLQAEISKAWTAVGRQQQMASRGISRRAA